MTIKKIIGAMGLLLAVLAFFPITAAAASGNIQFTTASSQVQKGDGFTVICQVTADESFLDTEFTVEYDPDIMEFVGGGKKVIGTGGVLKISSTGNVTATNKRTFSLQFAAAKKGTGTISVDGTAKVTGSDGKKFSVSSNRLAVTVSKNGADEQPAPAKKTAAAAATPAPVLSKNNKLKSLKTTALSMSPEFSGNVKDYTAVVDCETNTLYVTFEAEDPKAGIQLFGTEGLKTGENTVQVLVTAENGDKRKYNIAVTKETQTETTERKNEENAGSKDISFSIKRKKDRIILKNSYEFEVMDVSGLTNIPAGYVQSSIELNGISVPAFTMENDLDNNYLLLYLKGPAGKSNLYQYDRTEQTLQQYTGSMIERVNKGAGKTADSGGLIASNYVWLGIVVGLVIVILCMLIAMLKMAMKRRAGKNTPNDLDF